MPRRRATFLALACATVATGLVVHLRGRALEPTLRDVLGDALWAMLIAWLAGAFAPRATRAARGLSAYAICAAVESSQLLHSPTLDALRATMLGHLVLGSGFDPRDFVSYALGVAIAVGLETALGRKAAHHGPASLEADQPSPVTDRAPHETAGADTHHGIRDTRGG